jgi:nitroimidazol reductase NimA-like FMN-containing flavoprotein (pyridoxamine 5'-phosphate oxidase superfamily)
MDATTELASLEPRECLALLRTQAVGRLVFTEQALPAIRLVNFDLHQDKIVLRLGPSSWVRRLDGTVVAFEVDQIDDATRTGWSVVAMGHARLVTKVEELAELHDPQERPWVSGRRARMLCVSTERLTGRRVRLAEDVPEAGWSRR